MRRRGKPPNTEDVIDTKMKKKTKIDLRKKVLTNNKTS
jgi:hypothetical protein